MIEVVACKQMEDMQFEVIEVEPNALYQIIRINLREAKIDNVFEEYNKINAMHTYYREVTNCYAEMMRKEYE